MSRIEGFWVREEQNAPGAKNLSPDTNNQQYQCALDTTWARKCPRMRSMHCAAPASNSRLLAKDPDFQTFPSAPTSSFLLHLRRSAWFLILSHFIQRVMESPEDAQYGHIPFDIFALEEWDHSWPSEADAEHWGLLAKEYLSLKPMQRMHYHDAASNVQNGNSHPLLTPDNIARVLKPHQTIQERHVCTHLNGPSTPVWVRVCYDLALEDQYRKLRDGSAFEYGGAVAGEIYILEDASLYDAGPDYDRDRILDMIMTRMPSLSEGYPTPEVIREKERQLTGEEDLSKLNIASISAEVLIYVLDAEAIQENLVKLMWIDCYGKSRWNNKMRPEMMEPMRGMFLGGFSLEEAVEGLSED
ncbi:hypothetical protein AK830_g3332 [Neonectria ditissima]|uniref:Uncharacterized protein n=1 Tax=Neonectria ditissima TaxID=78410 RepID=A0A0P7BC60_9HYPO|nr:hypothetical protein AK830_g3332 [Neonectria ditissima]